MLLVEGSPAGIYSLSRVNATEYLPRIKRLQTLLSPDACCVKAVPYCQKWSGKPEWEKGTDGGLTAPGSELQCGGVPDLEEL